MDIEILVDDDPLRDVIGDGSTITISHCSTTEEDTLGINLLEKALDEAYEVGQQDYYDDLPSAQQLWERLMKVISVNV